MTVQDVQETWLQAYARTCLFNLFRSIKHGHITVICKYLPEKNTNHTIVFGNEDDDEHTTLTFNTPRAWDRIIRGFDLGIAEAFMCQELDSNNFLGLFTIYIMNKDVLGVSAGGWLQRLIPSLTYFLFGPNNNVTHARKNASFHYDTSNEHFASFLSPDMNYSSALWSDDSNESLETAQRRKVHNIIDKARISAGDHVLDIGCGWGDLAMEAVKKTGCRVTGLTLSSEQKLLAEKRIAEAGLQDRITILLCDYRNAPRPEQGYDRVVSVEMLEHVGEKYMKEYFGSISRLLKRSGGIMVVQGITIIQSLNGNSSNVGAFLSHYIFPGGYLATINELLASINAGSRGSLEVDGVQSIGPHYIKTLECWRNNFIQNWQTVRSSFISKNPDATHDEIEHFRRRWLYYFVYCEAGFRTRMLGDFVITAIRTPEERISGRVKYATS